MSHLSDDYTPSRSSVEPGFPEPVLVEEEVAYVASPAVGGTSTSTSSTTDSTKDVAADQAKQVKDQAVDTTKQVAGVAVEQAQSVAAEAKAQTRNVVHEARQQLTEQASVQQNNLASWISTLADELEQMVDRTQGSAQGSAQPGVATTVVRQVSERAHGAATWLQDHEPQDLLAETGRFARRRPGMFLALALAGGVLAGRVTRGLTADTDDETASPAAGSTSASSGTATYGLGYEPALVVTEHPVTYGTGASLAGSGSDLPAASGYTDSLDDVDLVDEAPVDRRDVFDDSGRL